MGKSELSNVKDHFNIRMRECRGIHTICCIIGVLFIINSIGIITQVLKFQEEVSIFSVTVYSNWAFALMLIACINYTFQYGEYNVNHQIFPQTRVSRFLSFEMYCYFSLIITQLFALGLYLLQYLLFTIVGQMKENVVLPYTFNLSFIFNGFFVTILYGSILTSIIILVGNSVRKFRLQAIIIYSGIFLFFWFLKDYQVAQNVILFYTNETSIFIFFIKAIVTWIILEIINHSINLHTSIVAERTFLYRHIIIASVILLLFLFSLLFSYAYQYQYTDGDRLTTQYQSIDPETSEPTLIIDGSKLSPNTVLNVDYENDNTIHNDIQFGGSNYNTTANKIMIYYLPQREYTNWINLSEYTKPRIIVSLTGNKLKIRVTQEKNVKLIALYPYSTLTQFKCFQNKSYAKPYQGFNMSRTVPGTILITTPERMHLTFE